MILAMYGNGSAVERYIMNNIVMLFRPLSTVLGLVFIIAIECQIVAGKPATETNSRCVWCHSNEKNPNTHDFDIVKLYTVYVYGGDDNAINRIVNNILYVKSK